MTVSGLTMTKNLAFNGTNEISGTVSFTGPLNTDASFTLTIAPNQYTDILGNQGQQQSYSNQFAFDNIDPSLTTIDISGSLPIYTGETREVILEFSEDMSHVAIANENVIVQNGTLSTLTQDTINLSKYTASFTPTANIYSTNGMVTISGDFFDQAGNSVSVSASDTIEVDTIIGFKSSKVLLKADPSLCDVYFELDIHDSGSWSDYGNSFIHYSDTAPVLYDGTTTYSTDSHIKEYSITYEDFYNKSVTIKDIPINQYIASANIHMFQIFKLNADGSTSLTSKDNLTIPSYLTNYDPQSVYNNHTIRVNVHENYHVNVPPTLAVHSETTNAYTLAITIDNYDSLKIQGFLVSTGGPKWISESMTHEQIRDYGYSSYMGVTDAYINSYKLDVQFVDLTAFNPTGEKTSGGVYEDSNSSRTFYLRVCDPSFSIPLQNYTTGQVVRNVFNVENEPIENVFHMETNVRVVGSANDKLLGPISNTVYAHGSVLPGAFTKVRSYTGSIGKVSSQVDGSSHTHYFSDNDITSRPSSYYSYDASGVGSNNTFRIFGDGPIEMNATYPYDAIVYYTQTSISSSSVSAYMTSIGLTDMDTTLKTTLTNWHTKEISFNELSSGYEISDNISDGQDVYMFIQAKDEYGNYGNTSTMGDILKIRPYAPPPQITTISKSIHGNSSTNDDNNVLYQDTTDIHIDFSLTNYAPNEVGTINGIVLKDEIKDEILGVYEIVGNVSDLSGNNASGLSANGSYRLNLTTGSADGVSFEDLSFAAGETKKLSLAFNTEQYDIYNTAINHLNIQQLVVSWGSHSSTPDYHYGFWQGNLSPTSDIADISNAGFELASASDFGGSAAWFAFLASTAYSSNTVGVENTGSSGTATTTEYINVAPMSANWIWGDDNGGIDPTDPSYFLTPTGAEGWAGYSSYYYDNDSQVFSLDFTNGGTLAFTAETSVSMTLTFTFVPPPPHNPESDEFIITCPIIPGASSYSFNIPPNNDSTKSNVDLKTDTYGVPFKITNLSVTTVQTDTTISPVLTYIDATTSSTTTAPQLYLIKDQHLIEGHLQHSDTIDISVADVPTLAGGVNTDISDEVNERNSLEELYELPAQPGIDYGRHSVAMNEDGTVWAIGAEGYDAGGYTGVNAGKLEIYENGYLIKTIVGSSRERNLGQKLEMDSTGQYVVYCGKEITNSTPAVRIYDISNDHYSDSISNPSAYVGSVDIVNTGSGLVVAFGDSNNDSVLVFDVSYSLTSYNQKGSDITSDLLYFGWYQESISLAYSNGSYTLAVGAPGGTTVKVYTYTENNWNTKYTLTVPTSWFGFSVSLAKGDGDKLAIGGAGFASVYDNQTLLQTFTTSWKTISKMSVDGSRLFIKDHNDVATIYKWNGTQYTVEHDITLGAFATGHFGALSGNGTRLLLSSADDYPTYVYGSSVITTVDNRVTFQVNTPVDDGFGDSSETSGIELIVEVSGNDADDHVFPKYQRIQNTDTTTTNYLDSIHDGIEYQYRYAHVNPGYYDLNGIVVSNWNNSVSFINDNGIADRVSDLSWTDYSAPVLTRRAPDAPASVATSANATYNDNQVGQVSLTITEDISYDRWGDVSMDQIVVRITGTNDGVGGTFPDQFHTIASSNQSPAKRTVTDLSHDIIVTGLGTDFSGNVEVAFTNSYKTDTDLGDLNYKTITGLHTRRPCVAPSPISISNDTITSIGAMVQITIPDTTNASYYGGNSTVDRNDYLVSYTYSGQTGSATYTTSMPTSGNVVDVSLSGLIPDTSYNVNARINLTAPSTIDGTSSSDVSFTTDSLSSNVNDGSNPDVFLDATTAYNFDAIPVPESEEVEISWTHNNPSPGDSRVYAYLITAKNGNNTEKIVCYENVPSNVSDGTVYTKRFGANDLSFTTYIPTDVETFLIGTNNSYINPSYTPAQVTDTYGLLVTKTTEATAYITVPEFGYPIGYTLRVIWQDQAGQLHSSNAHNYAITPTVSVTTTGRPEIVSVEKQITSSSYSMTIGYRTGGLDLQNFHIITTGDSPQHLDVSMTEVNTGNYLTDDMTYDTANLSYSEHETNDSVILFISNASGSNTYHLDLSGDEDWDASAHLLAIGSVTDAVAPQSKVLTFNGYDSYGDGWNGATITISVNEVVKIDSFTFNSGSQGSINFDANIGETVSWSWSTGSYDDEILWEIKESDGTVRASRSTSSATTVDPANFFVV